MTTPPCRVAVVVMLLPVEIVPKPEAIEPLVRAPVPVMLDKLPVVITVPSTFGSVMVLSAVGSVRVNKSSLVSAVEPSKIMPVEANEL